MTNWHDIENYDEDTPVILPKDKDIIPYVKECYGHSVVTLTDRHIEALQRGQVIIWSDGEYSTELRYNPF